MNRLYATFFLKDKKPVFRVCPYPYKYPFVFRVYEGETVVIRGNAMSPAIITKALPRFKKFFKVNRIKIYMKKSSKLWQDIEVN